MNLLTIDMMRRTVVSILAAERPRFDEQLSAIDAPSSLGAVLGYYTDALEIQSMPALMVAVEGKASDWRGLPDIAEERVTLSVYGNVHHDMPEVRERLIGALAETTQYVLNRRHRASESDGLYFREQVPMPEVQFGVTARPNVFVAIFRGLWTGFVQSSYVDGRPDGSLVGMVP